MSLDITEPVCVSNAYCDGLATVRIDQAGIARVNLYTDQLDPDGVMQRVLAARLTMTREVMVAIAGALLQESLITAARRARGDEDHLREMN